MQRRLAAALACAALLCCAAHASLGDVDAGVAFNEAALTRGPGSTGGDPHARTYATVREAWRSHFAFLMAVKPAARPTAAYVPDDLQTGYGKYALVGDLAGTLYAFSQAGELVGEFATEGVSPITAIAHTRLRSNASTVITGHADGCVRSHTTHELHRTRERPAQKHAIATLEIDRAASYCPPADAPADAAIASLLLSKVAPRSRTTVALAVSEGSEVVVLWGRSPYVVASAASILHLWYSSRQIRAVTAEGVAIATLHSNVTQLRPMTCHDLNGTRLAAAVSDAVTHAAHRAFAVSTEGDLLHFALGGDKRVINCRVRSRMPLTAPGAPVSLAVLDSHLLVATTDSLRVLNTSSPYSFTVKPWIHEPMVAFSRQLGVPGSLDPRRSPLLAASGAYVAVELAGGLVGVYTRPARPAPAGLDISLLKWSRPIMICAMICVAAWQFLRTRNASPAASLAASTRRFASGRAGHRSTGERMQDMDPELQRMLASYRTGRGRRGPD